MLYFILAHRALGNPLAGAIAKTVTTTEVVEHQSGPTVYTDPTLTESWTAHVLTLVFLLSLFSALGELATTSQSSYPLKHLPETR